jgi:hypothetical protein
LGSDFTPADEGFDDDKRYRQPQPNGEVEDTRYLQPGQDRPVKTDPGGLPGNDARLKVRRELTVQKKGNRDGEAAEGKDNEGKKAPAWPEGGPGIVEQQGQAAPATNKHEQGAEKIGPKGGFVIHE